MARRAIKRKICPNFDGVCLHGGCGWCNLGSWRSVYAIYNEAVSRGLLEDFRYGEENDFCNAQVKYDDGTLKYNRKGEMN